MKNDLEKKIEFIKEKVYIANEAKTEEYENFLKTIEGFAYSYNINLERLLIALNKIENIYFSDGNNVYKKIYIDGLYDLDFVCSFDLKDKKTISKLAEIFGYNEN